jgi:chaperonin GroEL
MAKKIELDDPFENMGAQMVKEVSTKVVRVAFRTTGSGALTAGSSAPCVILANSASSTNPSSLVIF